MADRSPVSPTVRYTVVLALIIVLLALAVMGAIIHQNREYRQISARTNEYHLRAAGIAAAGLSNLVLIENLLLTNPDSSYARARDLATYRELVAEHIVEMLALEAAYGQGENVGLVEKLLRQWQAFEEGTRGKSALDAQGEDARRQKQALLLTLHQMQRHHEIAYESSTVELALKRQAGAQVIVGLVLAALAIGFVVGWRVLGLIRLGEDKRLEAERALRANHDQLETMVAARTGELASANKELEAFAYSVSHDLRTHLRSIDGFSALLLEDYGSRLDASGRKYLERVRNGARQMGNLINDLLGLSRISRISLDASTVDLTAIAREIARNLSSLEPGRQVQWDIAENLVCQGDAGLLRIALENLLNNAWKYTGKTPLPHIRFGAEYRDGEAVFCVSDNGVGFDMQYADRLFTAFQRLHHKDEFEGTGIGLAIVARIVWRHGGRVWAEAAVGKGAALYFTLAPRETQG